MERKAASVDLIASVIAAVRAHRISATLCVIAAATWLLAVVWHDDPTIGMPVFSGETQVDDVDATLVSALLEMRDGEWQVRDGEFLRVPVAGSALVSVEHVADETLLFPRPSQFGALGGPYLRWSTPLWRIDARFRMVRRDGLPGVRVDEAGSAFRGWRMTAFWGNADIGSPMIVTGFNPLGWPMSYAPAGGGVLHVVALVDDTAPDLTTVDGWRALVAQDVERFAERTRVERDPAVRSAWWRSRAHQISTAAALSSVLRVDAATASLSELRADVGRDLSTGAPGTAFHAADITSTLDGALALLTPGAHPDPDALVSLLDHFAEPGAVRRRLATTYADTGALTSIDQLGRHTDVWRPRRSLAPPGPTRTAWVTPLLLFAVIGLVAAGGADRVRRRDVLAVSATFLVATSGAAIVSHVTLASLGQLALAALLLRLRARTALVVARGVPGALVLGAALLPIASALVLPVVEALSRAIAFVALAWLAAALLDPRPDASDAPRRTSRKRDILWTSVQLLALTVSALAFTINVVSPGGWSTQPPRLKWVLTALGLAVSLVAGILIYLRDRDRRVQPAVAAAVTIGTSSHMSTVALSTFVGEWTSGAKEVAAFGMISATILALFFVLRIGRMAVVARRRPALMPEGTAGRVSA